MLPLGYVARRALLAREYITPEEAGAESFDVFEPVELAPEISNEDAKALRRYFFALTHTGSILSVGSNFGAMLERMELFGMETEPCFACGGVRERWEYVYAEDDDFRTHPIDRVVITQAQPGTGYVTGSEAFREYMRIGKVGKLPRDAVAWVNEHAGGDYVCPKCEGKGWRTRALRRRRRLATVHARPGSGGGPNYETGGSDELATLGGVASRLIRVRAADPAAERFLAAVYGPEGTPSALWCYTPAGKKLLRGNSLDLPEQAYFEALKVAQELNRNPTVARQLAACERQSEPLLERMRSAWHAA